MLRKDGITPKVALCVIDREMGGTEALGKEGLELRRVFTMSALEAACRTDAGSIDQAVR
ncbi:MAG TPA: hypothetical protein VF210_17545 [Pseudomonadales bacterium]